MSFCYKKFIVPPFFLMWNLLFFFNGLGDEYQTASQGVNEVSVPSSIKFSENIASYQGRREVIF